MGSPDGCLGRVFSVDADNIASLCLLRTNSLEIFAMWCDFLSVLSVQTGLQKLLQNLTMMYVLMMEMGYAVIAINACSAVP